MTPKDTIGNFFKDTHPKRPDRKISRNRPVMVEQTGKLRFSCAFSAPSGVEIKI